MTAAVGHPTLRLVRVAIGPLRLAELGLAPGAWRALRSAEERALRESVARAKRPARRGGGGRGELKGAYRRPVPRSPDTGVGRSSQSSASSR